MEGSCWMEDSLRRTSALGRAVLERARCRELDWRPARTHCGRSLRTRLGSETPERYHSRIPAQEMTASEVQHFSRFHQPMPMKTPPSASPAAAPHATTRDPRDVHITVAPGTYSISAASPNGQTQTHVVNITPGQSVDLTFRV
ncbi:A-kinase-interacting protein 1 isoform X2 [Eleutherodactylus coqui]|uniref:A-kinase-interacting protein 1 isoform X2 n=1 Tax=Eleutherodactylus coqui TaxID=57060 RepID=UPI0034620574